MSYFDTQAPADTDADTDTDASSAFVSVPASHSGTSEIIRAGNNSSSSNNNNNNNNSSNSSNSSSSKAADEHAETFMPAVLLDEDTARSVCTYLRQCMYVLNVY